MICYKCKKKLYLLKFKCKCLQNFCIKCRLPEHHKCDFDYIKDNQIVLSKKLIKVIADKI